MNAPLARRWDYCRGCTRLRGTLDDNRVCDGCRPGVADGTIVPVDALDLADKPGVPMLPEDTAPHCVGSCDEREPRCWNCPNNGDDRATLTVKIDTSDVDAAIQQAVADAEPKQKPVKRRWFKRRP